MKRPRIGDVYTIKVPNGYKIFQWAYSIPKKGDFIRVFAGLHTFIPDSLFEIVSGPHSYIIAFDIKRAYRIGLAQVLGNYPIPDQFPFPDFMIALHPGGNKKIGAIAVDPTSINVSTSFRGQWYRVSRISELPYQFQKVTLLNSYLSPAWLLYLFDVDFSLTDLDKFFPCEPGENANMKLSMYADIVNEVLTANPSSNRK